MNKGCICIAISLYILGIYSEDLKLLMLISSGMFFGSGLMYFISNITKTEI